MQSLISDRFFLGGATDVRGFRYRGIGPRAGQDALGGDVYCAAGVHLHAPLPFAKWQRAVGNAVTTHVFGTCGSVVEQVDVASLPQLPGRLYGALAASVGAGVVINAGAFKMEVNVVCPVRWTAADQPVRGLQFGAGVQFL